MLLGTLGGIVIERVRFDRQRTAVLSRYQHAIREWQAEVMNVERQTQGVRSRWGHDDPASSQR